MKIWKRWQDEYLMRLRERRQSIKRSKDNNLHIGDVMLIIGDECNRGFWQIKIVEQLVKGKDGVVRAVKLRA